MSTDEHSMSCGTAMRLQPTPLLLRPPLSCATSRLAAAALITFGLEAHLSPVQRLAALFAAAVHDLAHPGTTNAHEMKILSADALRYSDSSVLEHHHLEVAFTLLHQPGFNFLRALRRDEYFEFRAGGAPEPHPPCKRAQPYTFSLALPVALPVPLPVALPVPLPVALPV